MRQAYFLLLGFVKEATHGSDIIEPFTSWSLKKTARSMLVVLVASIENGH
jgi:hypothetical protein